MIIENFKRLLIILMAIMLMLYPMAAGAYVNTSDTKNGASGQIEVQSQDFNVNEPIDSEEEKYRVSAQDEYPEVADHIIDTSEGYTILKSDSFVVKADEENGVNQNSDGNSNQSTDGDGNQGINGNGGQNGNGNQGSDGYGNQSTDGDGNQSIDGNGNQSGDGNQSSDGNGNQNTDNDGNQNTDGNGGQNSEGDGNQSTDGNESNSVDNGVSENSNSTEDNKAVLPSAKYTLELTKSQVISGCRLLFNDSTEKGRYLPSNTAPSNLKVRGLKNGLRLSWSKVNNTGAVDGLIIFRKDGSAACYKQLAKVSKTKTSYTDKTAARKNVLYRYCIIGYKYDAATKAFHISQVCCDWAGGTRSSSKKVNVYSVTVNNKMFFSYFSLGSSKTVKLTFPKRPISKIVRWSSANTNIAVVDQSGKVTAMKQGNTVIYGKLVSGNTVKVPVKVIKGGTAEAIVRVMKSWLSYSEKNKKHRKIIDIYNAYGNLPVNYKMKYSDAWCDACISAAAIASGNVDTIGRECGVARHIKIFKKLGIWKENGKIIPKPGDIIVYSWYKSKQPNNSHGNHIGIVLSVKNGTITTIEGNYSDKVKKRKIPVGWGFIRGYATPKYRVD